MTGRAMFVFACVFFSLPRLPADPIVVLFDASYSMSLPSASGSRIDLARSLLADWLAEQPSDAHYALLLAEHGDSPRLLVPYPARSDQVTQALRATVPWGSIDLLSTVEKAARTARSLADRTGAPARLLIVTDAEDLSALMPERHLPLPKEVTYEVLTVAAFGPASVAHLLADLVRHGETRRSDEPVSPVDALRTASPRSETEGLPDDSGPSVPAAEDSIIRRWARTARWVFLGAALLGSIEVVRAAVRHRDRLKRVLDHNEAPPVIHIRVYSPSGSAEHEISTYPVSLGSTDWAAREPDIVGAYGQVTIRRDEARLVLTASDTVKVNGVARREPEHELGERDQIRIGRVRMVITRIDLTKTLRPPRPTHRRYPIAPAAAGLTAIAAFLIALPEGGTAASVQFAPSATSAEAEGERADEPRLPGADARPTPTRSPRMPGLRLPTVVDPSDRLPDFHADFLAIHAHPDDESLDFGAALAAMGSAGLRGAVVLLTDGSAGRDQFPWRGVDNDYPSHRLVDEALERVRVDEAHEAIGWLGVHYYVRMGLTNHPYNSTDDELTAGEVFDRWGGRRSVVDRLVEILVHMRPRFVISPDGPSAAIEHFEHEATGLAVAEAIARLRDVDDSIVRAHLVGVDPLQAFASDEVLAVSPWDAGPDGTVPRLRQLLALRAHRSQRDATVIGVETRLALPAEYYRVRAYDPLFSTDELFGAETSIPDGKVDPDVFRP